jgi:hypothetical protein
VDRRAASAGFHAEVPGAASCSELFEFLQQSFASTAEQGSLDVRIPDDTRLIDDKGCGNRDAVPLGGVVDSVVFYHGAFTVSQQRKRNRASVLKFLQLLNGVGADGDNLRAGFAEPLISFFQALQLKAANRSPHAAKEREDYFVSTE